MIAFSVSISVSVKNCGASCHSGFSNPRFVAIGDKSGNSLIFLLEKDMRDIAMKDMHNGPPDVETDDVYPHNGNEHSFPCVLDDRTTAEALR